MGLCHVKMPLQKAHLIDKRPWWAGALIAIGYCVAFAICVGVGSAGPSPVYIFNTASTG